MVDAWNDCASSQYGHFFNVPSSCTLARWFRRVSAFLSFFPHTGHCTFGIGWLLHDRSKCLLNSFFRKNKNWHFSHWNLRSFVCLIMWSLKWSFLINPFPHNSHVNLNCRACHFMWLSKCFLVANSLAHVWYLHLYNVPSCLTRICCLSRSEFTYSFLQWGHCRVFFECLWSLCCWSARWLGNFFLHSQQRTYWYVSTVVFLLNRWVTEQSEITMTKFGISCKAACI